MMTRRSRADSRLSDKECTSRRQPRKKYPQRKGAAWSSVHHSNALDDNECRYLSRTC
jgi:hypothetical protein